MDEAKTYQRIGGDEVQGLLRSNPQISVDLETGTPLAQASESAGASRL
jgi:hypothetical protein